jgi:hypothetical protein
MHRDDDIEVVVVVVVCGVCLYVWRV